MRSFPSAVRRGFLGLDATNRLFVFPAAVAGTALWAVLFSDLPLFNLTSTARAAGFLTLIVAGAAMLLWRSEKDGRTFEWCFPALLGFSVICHSPPVADRLPMLAPWMQTVLPCLVGLHAAAFLIPMPWLTRIEDLLTRSRSTPWIFAILMILYSAVAMRFLATKGFHSGDESHYLVQTVSLWEDHDLDLSNNLGPDFAFTKESFDHFHIAPMSTSGQAHSWHPFGLSLLMLPGYAMAGVEGATLTLAAIGGLHGILIYQLLRTLTGNSRTALRVCAIFCLTMPMLIYAVRAYPEMAAASVYLLVYRLFIQRDRLALPNAVIAGVALGFLPWLLIRRFHIPWAVLNVMGACALFRGRDLKALAALALPQVLMMAALSWINSGRYAGNSVCPEFYSSAITGGGGELWTQVRALLRWDCFHPGMLPAVFIDKRFGMVWGNPFLVLWVPIAACVGIGRLRKHWRWLAIFLGVYVLTTGTALGGWTAGTASHPPRYLVAVLPFLAIPLALHASRRASFWRSGGVKVTLLLAALSTMAILRMPTRFECPYFAFTCLNPALHQLAAALPWFPSFFHAGPIQAAQAAYVTFAICILAVFTFTRAGGLLSEAGFFLLLTGAMLLSAAVV